MDAVEHGLPTPGGKVIRLQIADTPSSSANTERIGLNLAFPVQEEDRTNMIVSSSSAENEAGDGGSVSDEPGTFVNFDGVHFTDNYAEYPTELKLDTTIRGTSESDFVGQSSIEPPGRPRSKHGASASQQVQNDWADLMAARVAGSQENMHSSACPMSSPIKLRLITANGDPLETEFVDDDFISRPERVWNKEITAPLPDLSRLSPEWERRTQTENSEREGEHIQEEDCREDEKSRQESTFSPDHPEESPERRKQRLEHRYQSDDLGINEINDDGVIITVGKPPTGTDSDLAQLENLHLRDSTASEGVQRLKEIEDLIDASIKEIPGQMSKITSKFQGIPLLYSLDDEVERISNDINMAIKLRDNELARKREFGMNYAKTKLLKDIDGDRRSFFTKAPGVVTDALAMTKRVTTPPIQKMTPTPPPSSQLRSLKKLQIGSLVYKERIKVLEKEIRSLKDRVERRNKEIEKLAKDYNEAIQENEDSYAKYSKASKKVQRLKENEADAVKKAQVEKERADALNDEFDAAKQAIEELHKELALAKAGKERVDAELRGIHSHGSRAKDDQHEQTVQLQHNENEPEHSQHETTVFEKNASTDLQPTLAHSSKFDSTYRFEIDRLTSKIVALEKKLENAEWELTEREKYYSEEAEEKVRQINASNGEERRQNQVERRKCEEKKQEYRSKLRKAQNELTAANAKIQALQEQMEAVKPAKPTSTKPEKEEIVVSLDESSFFDDSEDPSSPFPARLQRVLEVEKDRWDTGLRIADLDSRISKQEEMLERQKVQSKQDALTIRLQARQIRALRGDIEFMQTGVRNDAEGQLILPSTLASPLRIEGPESDPEKRRKKYEKLREEMAVQLWMQCETKVAKFNEQASKLKDLGVKGVQIIGENYVADMFHKKKLARPDRLHWKGDEEKGKSDVLKLKAVDGDGLLEES
jgi:hypothetical protein